MLRLVIVVLFAPAGLAQPITDPPPSTAEVAPGVALTVDWDLMDADALADGGCERWNGEYSPSPHPAGDAGGNEEIYLREATLEIDGRRVDLDAQCVGGYIWSLASTEAEAFETTRPLADALELTLRFDWDASGSSTLTWTVGPTGTRRTEAYDGRAGIATPLRNALDAEAAEREALARALAASVAATRAASAARERVAQQERTLLRAGAHTRTVLDGPGAVLDSIGIALPALPSLDDAPLQLTGCTVAPDSTGASDQPSLGMVLTARVATSTAAIAWVDLGDGTSDLVAVDGGRLHVPHVYASPGTYRATITATDPGGSETCAIDVTVGDGEAPVCADVTELNPVYFDLLSDALSADGRERIAENADLLLSCPSLCVAVAGHGDMLDADRMDARRADAVRNAYLDHGLAASRVWADGRGEPPYCSAIDDPGPGDRRCRMAESSVVSCAEAR